MTNLRAILNAYQAGERGLPDFRECCEIASQYDDLQRRFTQVVTGEHDEQKDKIRFLFERDCT